MLDDDRILCASSLAIILEPSVVIVKTISHPTDSALALYDKTS